MEAQNGFLYSYDVLLHLFQFGVVISIHNLCAVFLHNSECLIYISECYSDRALQYIFIDMVAIAYRSAVANPVGASPSSDPFAAADGAYMPAEAMAASTAYQQATERVFTGVSAAAYRGILFVPAALHLCLCHIKHLLRDNCWVSVLCIVHRRLTGILHPALG